MLAECYEVRVCIYTCIMKLQLFASENNQRGVVLKVDSRFLVSLSFAWVQHS